jgi:hypothetical protein
LFGDPLAQRLQLLPGLVQLADVQKRSCSLKPIVGARVLRRNLADDGLGALPHPPLDEMDGKPSQGSHRSLSIVVSSISTIQSDEPRNFISRLAYAAPIVVLWGSLLASPDIISQVSVPTVDRRMSTTSPSSSSPTF